MKRYWTPEEDQLLKELYADNLTADIARRLNRPLPSVYNRANMFGLKKSALFFESGLSNRLEKGSTVGRKTQFKKGQDTWNKGMKGLRVSPKSEFKKGNIPWNSIGKKDGDISIRTDNRGVKCPFIRVSLGKWVSLHRYVWEQANGPIPTGLCLVFKDRDPMNCALENLELITRVENMRRNTIHNYPEEVKPVIKLISKIRRTIKRHEKQD